MKDENKTKEQLITELGKMRQRITELTAHETEHNKTEESRRDSGWRDIFQAIGHPIVILAPDHTIIAANPATVKAARKSEDELLGKKCWEIFHEADQPPENYPLKKMLDSGCLEVVEMEIEAFGGIYMVSCTPIFDDAGRLQEIIHIATDITKRKQAEETKLRFKTITDQAGYGVAMSSLEGEVIYANESFARMHGYAPNELIGKHLSALHDEAQMRDMKGLMEQLSLDGSFTAEESWHKRRGSSSFLASMNGTLTKDEAGTPLFMAVTITDITEHKWADEKYQTIVEGTIEGFSIDDMEGRILEANESYCKMVGYTREELLTMSIQDIDAADSPEEIVQNLKYIPKEGLRSFETRHRRKDGRIIDVEISANYLDVEGGRIFVFIRDITERKRAEEALRENEEKYRTVFENTGAATAIVEQDMTISLANEECSGLFGYSKEEVEGKKRWTEFVVEKEELERMKEYHRLRRMDPASVPKSYESHILDKEGNVRDILITTAMIPGTPKSVASLVDITERKKAEESLEKSYATLKKTLSDAINTMARIVEMRDPYTAGHQQRVTQLATAIAKELKFDESRMETLRMAAIIHDIGKIYVPSDILNKPGNLSSLEFQIIKTHPQGGYDIVKGMDFPCIVAQAILEHHERLDGSGYPHGLKNKDIAIEAKIMAVADVVEAMATHRPYRPALGVDKALEEITANKGILYDPNVVEACVRLFREEGFNF